MSSLNEANSWPINKLLTFLALFILANTTSCLSDIQIEQQVIGSKQMSKRHSEMEKDFAPKLIHQQQNELVQPNKPHTIECNVEAKPEPEVKWFKDDQLLNIEAGHLDQIGKELMFFQVNEEDTGDYQCQATNDLGSITSKPFRLTVQTSVHDPKLRFEPRLAKVGTDQQAEFTCTIPIGQQQQQQQQQQRTSLAPEVSWRRNGKRLPVTWLDKDEEVPVGKMPSGRSEFAKQVELNQFKLILAKVQLRDDNTTFTCLYKFDTETSSSDQTSGGRDDSSSLANESSLVRLRVYSGSTINSPQEPPLDGSAGGIKLPDVDMGQPIDNLESLGSPNRTSTLSAPNGYSAFGRALGDIYELAKPTLVILGLLLLASSVVILQWVYIRRKTRQNRYTKHQYNGGSSGSGASVGLGGAGGIVNCDPVLSSLMGRTLSAPNAAAAAAASLSGKKYRSYRDHMRKVAAAADHLVAAGDDYVDATGYFNSAQHSSYRTSNELPFNFNQSAQLPNLYNQSLAAREQARNLLQASEHMRSLNNLSGQLQMKHNATAQGLRLSQNGSHLNLPLSFAFGAAPSNGNQQLQSNNNNDRLADSQMMQANALWPHNLLSQLSQQNQRDEHYQLVNCASSISPSSTSNDSNCSSSRIVANNIKRPNITTLNQLDNGQYNNKDSTSLNHYSTIETNEDEDDRYEEVNQGNLAMKRSRDQRDQRVRAQQQQQDIVSNNRTSTFVNNELQSDISGQKQQQQKSSLRSSFISSTNSSSTSGCGDSTNTTTSSLINEAFNRFGSKRNSRQQTNNKEKRQLNYPDQLSPYAVSSICGPTLLTRQEPPPVPSNEAMKALNDQFDISHLMLLEGDVNAALSLPFETPPPPPHPPSSERLESN